MFLLQSFLWYRWAATSQMHFVDWAQHSMVGLWPVHLSVPQFLSNANDTDAVPNCSSTWEIASSCASPSSVSTVCNIFGCDCSNCVVLQNMTVKYALSWLVVVTNIDPQCQFQAQCICSAGFVSTLKDYATFIRQTVGAWAKDTVSLTKTFPGWEMKLDIRRMFPIMGIMHDSSRCSSSLVPNKLWRSFKEDQQEKRNEMRATFIVVNHMRFQLANVVTMASPHVEALSTPTMELITVIQAAGIAWRFPKVLAATPSTITLLCLQLSPK